MLFLILALRVLLSPLTNVYQKKLIQKEAHPLFIVALTYLVIALLFLPFFVMYAEVKEGFWFTILLASIIDAAGNIFLVKALETTELSVFGPINSFKPAIALLVSFFILNEIPTTKAVIGVLIIIAGSILFTAKKSTGKTNFKGLYYRVAGIVCSSFGAVLIKKAINLSNPEISLLLWTIVALPFFAIIIYFLYKPQIFKNLQILKNNKQQYILLFLTYSAMQYVTLLSFKVTFVGYSLAIFQLSSIISIFLGYRYFKEKNIVLKLISSLIMIVGALLILL